MLDRPMEMNWNYYVLTKSYLNVLNLIEVLPRNETKYKRSIHQLKPTGNCETLFPSILNSSSFEQLANEDGMVERRLYLINNRLRFFKFPIDSGRSMSSLWVRSNVVNWAQFPMNTHKKKTNQTLLFVFLKKFNKTNKPIASGKCSRWLCATSSVNNWIKWPTVVGSRRIRFSRKLNICKFFKQEKNKQSLNFDFSSKKITYNEIFNGIRYFFDSIET